MHLFAGVGGGLLADLILGHRPIIAVEWEPYACQVLRERAAEGWFPDLSVWEGDVRLFDPSEYTGRVGCIHAGFPCQDISVAGKQAGVGEETRSGLYREVIRIARVVRPRYLFMENVAAIVSNGLGTVLGDLAALGYDSEWLCLRASDCGAPHHRNRWWLLATMADPMQRRENWEANTREPSISNKSCEWLDKRQEGYDNRVMFYSNPNHLRRLEQSGRVSNQRERIKYGDWWSVEPDIPRVVNGLANQMDREAATGNGQVALQCAVAWKLLGGE